MELLVRLFDTSGFPPRWHCGNWTQALGWLHIASDLGIFAAYTATPLVIAYFVLRRKDVPFPRVCWLFILFIFVCGVTHLLEALIFWHPVYRLAGLMKLTTALVSWATVMGLVLVMPSALRFPGLAKLNDALTREIEDRRQTEAALRQTEEWLRLAQQAGGVGTFAWDLVTRHARVSETYRSIFGLPPDREWTNWHEWYSTVHPEDRDWMETHIATIHQAPTGSAKYRILRPDGEVRWVHYTGRIERGPDNRPVRLTGTVQDITARKEAEVERETLLQSERAARAEAERANRLKDEFLSIVSHELRTPLAAMLGYAQLLQTGKLDPQQWDSSLASIVRNGRAQSQIIDDLLDMSRIVAGKIKLDVREVYLGDVIQAAVETVRPAADARHIRLETQLDADASPVLGDFDRLQQVVWNLLSNAVKFTPNDGTVRVSLERVDDSHVEVRVSDTGSGIAVEFLPYVFDRFRQAEGATSRHHGGLGLGLAIVKQLVELHGGTVSADSGGDGQGATFQIRLPVLVLQNQRLPGQRSGAESIHRPGPVADLTGLRLLVVDDEPDAREVVAQFLSGCGAEVALASSAREALELFSQMDPSGLISDIGMPGMDGYELIQAVRSLPASRGGNIPAVALTAFARAEDRKRSLLAGFQAHVTKPVDPGELVAAIASLVGRTGKVRTD